MVMKWLVFYLTAKGRSGSSKKHFELRGHMQI